MNIDMKYKQFLDDFNKQLNGCLIGYNEPDIEHFKYAIDNIDSLNDETLLGLTVIEPYNKYEMTVGDFNKMMTLNPKAKDMCKGSLKLFLEAYIEYRKTIVKPIKLVDDDFDGVEQALLMMKSEEYVYLHKPCDDNEYDGMLTMELENTFNNLPISMQIKALRNIIPCVGLYNGRAVLCLNDNKKFDKYGTPYINKYYVAMNIPDIMSKMRQYKMITVTDKKTKKEKVIKTEPYRWPLEQKPILEKAIVSYTKSIQKHILERVGLDESYRYKFIMFEQTDNYDNDTISPMIRKLWDVKLGGLDVRTGTSLTDSYMTMLGWYFSPVDKSNRYAGSFFSPASGIGKTAIMEMLCKRTDVVHETLSQTNGAANQFSFAGALGVGPDILRSDDPMQGTEDILNLVSTLVSNKECYVEYKGRDRYRMEELYTKVIITSNKPLYMKNDTNNFMTAKLFELQTNNMQHLTDSDESSRIVEHIEKCPIQNINAFLSKCVKMYQDNPGWIKQHLGQYISDEDEALMFSTMLDLNKLKNPDNRTLIECVTDDAYACTHVIRGTLTEAQYKWGTLCKYIDQHYNKLATIAVCSVVRDNLIYTNLNSRVAKSRRKNFRLDDMDENSNSLRTIIVRKLEDYNKQYESEVMRTNSTKSETSHVNCVYNGKYEDLLV